jgi:hypothetical protein
MLRRPRNRLVIQKNPLDSPLSVFELMSKPIVATSSKFPAGLEQSKPPQVNLRFGATRPLISRNRVWLVIPYPSSVMTPGMAGGCISRRKFRLSVLASGAKKSKLPRLDCLRNNNRHQITHLSSGFKWRQFGIARQTRAQRLARASLAKQS